MVDEVAPAQVQAQLAGNVRRLRIARHLSLSQLARATGMSKATLSSIENGRANPTVETLVALARALRIGLAELLEELPLGDLHVVRAGPVPPGRRGNLAQRPLEEIVRSARLEVSELELAARESREADALAPGSRVALFILAGTLIAGPVERSTELGPGDYVSFPADVPHVFQTGRRAARALVLAQAPP
jgi:transcriptional regulator with XRE-family HTH domain